MVRLAWCLVASLVLFACGDNLGSGSPDLQVSATAINLAAGDTTSVTVAGALGDVTFTSSDSSVVTVTPAGTDAALVRAIGVGTATITITSGIVAAQQTATIPVTITAAELRTLGVTPPMPTIAHATTVQLFATGVYSDATTKDLTAQVTWNSSDITTATVDANGVVTGGAAGTVSVIAVLGSVSGSSTVTVTQATLTSIAVTPANPTVIVGLQQALTATGTFSDQTTQDLTSMVTWSSDMPSHVTVVNVNQAHGVAAGTATITATLGAISGSTVVTCHAATLLSIEVDPATPEIPYGGQRQFTAIGHYDDGQNHDITSMVTWLSGTLTTATIDNTGLASAVGPGTTTISATLGAISGSTVLTVDAAVLQSISVTPANQSVAKGRTQQYTAMGVYTDASMHDITTQVTWTCSTGNSISNAAGSQGLATAQTIGTPTITATLGTIAGSTTMTVTAAVLASIAVTPINPSAPKNFIVQFTAMGTFSDATVSDLTSSVTWASSDITLADVSNAAGSHGLATTFLAGTPTISATLGAISGSTVLTVTTTSLDQIQVTPSNPNIPLGPPQQFTATGVFSDATTLDMTTMVAWSSGTPATATISNAAGSQGLATLHAPGTSLIEATFGPVIGASGLTVSPAGLVSISVSPLAMTIGLPGTQQFTATAHYTDATTADFTSMVTWDSSNPEFATIAASGGLATSVATGTTTITATLGALTASTTLTVGAAALVSIAVTPANPSVAKGLTQQFTATGTYSDLSTADITTQVSWTSSDVTMAQVTSQGLATGVAIGAPTITATMGAISGSTTLTVTGATLVSIAVTPTTATVSVGNAQPYVATGTFSDNTQQVITSTVTWTTGDVTIATVTNTPTHGVVSGVAVNSTTVTATQPATTISGSANVTVVGLQISATTPADGVSGIKTNTVIEVAFDHAITAASVTAQATTGPCISNTLQVSSDDFVNCVGLGAQTLTGTIVSYPIVAALTTSTTYKIKVLGTITNDGGIAMGADFVQTLGWQTTTGGTCTSSIVISQVYGGGGNGGATFTNDFIELHNRGANPESLANLTLQYAATSGVSWQVTTLPAISIPAGGYYLVAEHSGGAVGAPLTPDFTANIDMAAANGKVALTESGVTLSGSCPLTHMLDFVGYGTANCSEGAAAPALSATKSAIRGTGGCDDTDANNTDFTAVTPAPRNSATTAATCAVCP